MTVDEPSPEGEQLQQRLAVDEEFARRWRRLWKRLRADDHLMSRYLHDPEAVVREMGLDEPATTWARATRRWALLWQRLRADDQLMLRFHRDPEGVLRETGLDEPAKTRFVNLLDKTKGLREAVATMKRAAEAVEGDQSGPFAAYSIADLIRLGLLAREEAERLRHRPDEDLHGWGNPSEWQERLEGQRRYNRRWAEAAATELASRPRPPSTEERVGYDEALTGLRSLAQLTTG